MSKQLVPAHETIDRFDLALGNLSGLPEGLETKPSTIQVLIPVVGKAETFIVQTIRHEIGKKKPKGKDEDEGEPIYGFTQFLIVTSARGTVRLVLPPDVSDKLAQQRESLAARVRRRGAQKAVQTRLDRGDVLGNPEALRNARRAPRKARKGKR